MVSTSRPFELLHLDLFGPIASISFGGKAYTLVIVDDYTRYTWIYFLAHKDETFNVFTSFSKKVQGKKGLPISFIRSDHGREFENQFLMNFVQTIAFFITFQLLEPHNEMEL